METLLRYLVVFFALMTGCSLMENGARTMILEPLHFYYYSDKYISRGREYQMAKAAWSEVVAAHGEGAYSADYRTGFIAGFMDFVDKGGNGEPPPVPPRRYWNYVHRDPEGYQASQDWFSGFRHGAAVAQAAVGHPTIMSSLLVGPLDPWGASAPMAEILPPPREELPPPLNSHEELQQPTPSSP
jgi:hypothetical protein